ncbi:MAG: molybdate ABC transporter substrate-binding protein [Halothiobacillaceae bacterium]
MTKIFFALLLVIGLFSSGALSAAPLTVAVAANFTKTIEEIGTAFTKQTGHEVRFSFGPTGKLYAQIKNGAPFDAFFAADTKRPRLLVEEGQAVPESYFVYAVGRLALYSPKLPVADDPQGVLEAAGFRHFSLANPRTAPYGVAGEEVLTRMGLLEALRGKIVHGESIAHAFQYVATGNAPLGFIALAQIVDPDSPVHGQGQYWIPPQEMYPPLEQAAVILERGANKTAMREFIEFVRSGPGREIIARYGYDLPRATEPAE